MTYGCVTKTLNILSVENQIFKKSGNLGDQRRLLGVGGAEIILHDVAVVRKNDRRHLDRLILSSSNQLKLVIIWF